MTWLPGDIGAVSGTAFADRLIQFGQLLRIESDWHWNHVFVVVDASEGTIEAEGHGVVRGQVSRAGTITNLGCPDGVDRDKVVSCAISHLGNPYSYFDVTLLGIDCVLGTRFHQRHGDSVICSELVVECLIAGGWNSPMPPSLTKPADVVNALKVIAPVVTPAAVTTDTPPPTAPLINPAL